jgi:hypothetical protein
MSTLSDLASELARSRVCLLFRRAKPTSLRCRKLPSVRYFFFVIEVLLTPRTSFDSAWTALTSGVYSILFLHPTWALLPVASVAAQWIWLFLTWLLWIVGAALLNGSLPKLITGRVCDAGLVFCSQIQVLFGEQCFNIQLFRVGV